VALLCAEYPNKVRRLVLVESDPPTAREWRRYREVLSESEFRRGVLSRLLEALFRARTIDRPTLVIYGSDSIHFPFLEDRPTFLALVDDFLSAI